MTFLDRKLNPSFDGSSGSSDELARWAASLRDQSKLIDLGKMAASIVHEINSPLSIIQARAALLSSLHKDGRGSSQNTIEAADKILETTRRITKIIGGLSAFLGNSDQETTKEVLVKDWITETLSFSEAHLRDHQIEFEYREPEPELSIRCKPVQLSQVILNLLTNASDAVAYSKQKYKWIKLEVKDFSDRVAICVSNSGKNISPEVFDQMFTPFFTTKIPGRGTGLGLSISNDIVRAHGGELKHDALARHTTFSVTLPKQDVNLKLVLNR